MLADMGSIKFEIFGKKCGSIDKIAGLDFQPVCKHNYGFKRYALGSSLHNAFDSRKRNSAELRQFVLR